MSSPPNAQGYLSNLATYSPWASRSATPKLPGNSKDADKKSSEPAYSAQRGGDHTVNNRHRLSLRKYPRDCPPLEVQWFHAIDIPKRKPGQQSSADAAPVPKKYVPFSQRDSRAIETTFQKLAEEGDGAEKARLARSGTDSSDYASGDIGVSAEDSQDTKLRKSGTEADGAFKVPVNEDYLFDVDVERRELAPVYWLGPVYNCRRGTWFYVDGKPCDENLATQLEEGYLKLSPWKFPKLSIHKRSASSSGPSRSRPNSLRLNENPLRSRPTSGNFDAVTPKSSGDDLRKAANELSVPQAGTSDPSLETIQRTFRLFGAHMNSVVTYEDETVAWIMSDDFLSGMRGTMYERFAGGAHFAGVKVFRGCNAAGKTQAKEERTEESLKGADGSKMKEQSPVSKAEEEQEPQSPGLHRRITLERQMSSLMESGAFESKESQEEEMRKRDEKEIQDDYKESDEDEQGRDIEHLILVTHGIGQQLGLRFESVNFVHDVNTLRKTLKAVYSGSADLQALNNEVDKPTKNCRIQVLPICWRHLLDFPKHSLKHNRKEHDLGDAHDEEEDEKYPSIDDITVNNVFRSLITDLALDILLYQSPAYKNHITRIVLEECNRIYNLFRARNPGFKGRISLMGHSLGSAIMFDILCKEKSKGPVNKHFSLGRPSHRAQDLHGLAFDVEDFYALGSPVGLFQMLEGRSIAARQTGHRKSQNFDVMDESFSSTNAGLPDKTVVSPKVQRLYNIFHPTDPISYRLEPLISSAMAGLKPQPLPYTKKGIFGASGAGITGIGTRVGQSVSGLWSSFSSGIASSLLNRSLGISADDAARVAQSRAPLGSGAGTSVAGGMIPPAPVAASDAEKLIRGDLGVREGEEGQHPPTLLDGEIETLYSGFQKANPNPLEQDDERREMEENARKIKREESKVRALNANGRVDYNIQEGTFDLSLLGGIASHLSYWAEEDISHFLISQLLSRHRVMRNRSQKGPGN